MASSSDITTLLAEIALLGLLPADIVALCDRAIADLLSTKRPYVSYNQGGRQVNFSYEGAMQVRRYYEDLRRLGSGGGLNVSFAEFG